MQFLKIKFIGLLFLPLFVLAAAPNTYALFSPRIATEVELIRQHVLEARQLNGTGGLAQGGRKIFTPDIVDKSVEKDRADAEAGGVTGLPGLFHQLRQEHKAIVTQGEFENFGESFALLFNYLPKQTYDYYDENGVQQKTDKPGGTITSCLRDDLFELEDFKDAVFREMMRSALLLNPIQARTLQEDYDKIRAIASLLKVEYENTGLLFGQGEINYYIGEDCPLGGFAGEFGLAFERLKESWDTFATLASGGGIRRNTSSAFWGNLAELAERRAAIRASNWIAANQISLSIGGDTGASPTSLIDLYKRGGWKGIGNSLLKQLDILTTLIDLNAPIYDPDNYRSQGRVSKTTSATINDIKQGLEKQSVTFNRAATALEFNLEFSTLGRSSLENIEKTLTGINTQIKAASGAFGDQAGPSLRELYEQLETIRRNQCVNKGN